MTERTIRFRLNGAPVSTTVPADRFAIDLLRIDLGATGTKLGCGIGVCGACSILVDGSLVSGCLLPAVVLDGCDVTTVEGLAAPDGGLSRLQRAFIERGGFQCGICTPGQLMAATALLAEQPRPTTVEIREWMLGNLCRCTGYTQIVDAISAAAAGPDPGGPVVVAAPSDPG